MGQRKIRTYFNCFSSGANRRLEPFCNCVDHRKCVVCIGISFVKLNSLYGRFHALPQIRDGTRPAIKDNSGADPTEPEMRFRKFGIELTSLSKQFPGFQMVLTGHLMKVPSPTPHKVPSRYITRVSGRRLGSFSPEQLRFDSACYALCDCVLNGKHLGQFEVIALSPDVFARRGVD